MTILFSIPVSTFGFDILGIILGGHLATTVFLLIAWATLDKRPFTGETTPWQRLKECRLFEYVRDYFPNQCVDTAELPPSQNYMFIMHPHGIVSMSAVWCNFAGDSNGNKKQWPNAPTYGIHNTVTSWVMRVISYRYPPQVPLEDADSHLKHELLYPLLARISHGAGFCKR